MNRFRLRFRIARLVGLIFTAPLILSCLETGQIHGMLDLSFPSTQVCSSQEKLVDFKNTFNEAIVIEGVAISGGTDPDGNFNLQSVKIGDQETKATGGIFSCFPDQDITKCLTIPPKTAYSFAIGYKPHKENSQDTAVLDIAYFSPKEGIFQVTLTGSSTTKSALCPTGNKSAGGGGDLTGEATIAIDRIALVSSALPNPISTDVDNTFVPYIPVSVSAKFDAANDSVILRNIPEGLQFKLPRTRTQPLSNLITDFTFVTSAADASGSYKNDGSIFIQDVPIHLKEKFEADLIITLTTDKVTIPTNLPKKLLGTAGFPETDDQKFILGSPVDSKTFKVTLVGIATFSNAKGSGDVARSLSSGGVSGAVLIEGTVNPPAK